MSANDQQIFVKSHVARDLMQSAGLFKTDKLVVWEYVSNGLQYVDPGTNPVVKVSLDSKKKKITIADNGRGMDWDGLRNFFVMHGENIDRKQGHGGRGRFGTGKSAAFGIADGLRITTVCRGKRTKVELTRSSIEAMNSEDPIPVKLIEREVSSSESNGTTVEIDNIHLRSLDQAGIIHYIERHLAHWTKNVLVFVNNHECEFAEPPVAEEKTFRPDRQLLDQIGDVELIIKVSKAPLEEDLRGVTIFSKGVWHETTLAGSEGREMAQYIFGEIDVPRLDEDNSPIAPFDVSRSMRLNPNNDLVRAVYAFIGLKVEEIRKELTQAEKQRKVDEDARKLATQAAEIASVINEDFDTFRQRVAKVKAQAAGAFDLSDTESQSSLDESDVIFGSEVPAVIVSESGGIGTTTEGSRGGAGNEPRTLAPLVTPGSAAAERQGQGGQSTKSTPKPKGGFDVKFKNLGSESHRAQYMRDDRTIYINLEHPQLLAAKGKRAVEDPVFRRLAYEVAFSEYAVALASELAARDEYIDPSDPIFDIRETLNRVARKGALLYSE